LKKIVYFPCDYYLSMQQMSADAFLKRCRAVISQSRRLEGLIKELNPNVFFTHHNGKFILGKMNDYKENGFVLWVGFSGYLNYMKEYLARHPLKNELVILTDFPDRIRLPGRVRQLRWTTMRYRLLMAEAKAAIDIKGSDFNQLNRPAEKLQTFIASGLPCACNKGPISLYFKDCGLDIALPEDTQRWFSRQYYDETLTFGKALREQMSLVNVGREVKDIIDRII